VPHVTRQLAGLGPVIAVTDYVAALPQTIASFVEAPFTAFGTHCFGRSDTRRVLRRFLEVERHHVSRRGRCWRWRARGACRRNACRKRSSATGWTPGARRPGSAERVARGAAAVQ
jgi:hypothetical protein